jgi:hypothetical protein
VRYFLAIICEVPLRCTGRSSLSLELFPPFEAGRRGPQSAANDFGQPSCQQVNFGNIKVLGWQRSGPPAAGQRPQRFALAPVEACFGISSRHRCQARAKREA